MDIEQKECQECKKIKAITAFAPKSMVCYACVKRAQRAKKTKDIETETKTKTETETKDIETKTKTETETKDIETLLSAIREVIRAEMSVLISALQNKQVEPEKPTDVQTECDISDLEELAEQYDNSIPPPLPPEPEPAFDQWKYFQKYYELSVRRGDANISQLKSAIRNVIGSDDYDSFERAARAMTKEQIDQVFEMAQRQEPQPVVVVEKPKTEKLQTISNDIDDIKFELGWNSDWSVEKKTDMFNKIVKNAHSRAKDKTLFIRLLKDYITAAIEVDDEYTNEHKNVFIETKMDADHIRTITKLEEVFSDICQDGK